MRKILFRGQSEIDGNWLYGLYGEIMERSPIGYCIIPVIQDLKFGINEPIHKRTVGQYVGIEDSAGNKIFEGDILKNVFGEYGIVECSDNFFYIRKALTNEL